MVDQIKRFLLSLPGFRKCLTLLRRTQQPVEHVLKQAAIRELAEKFGTRIFVETGTYRGEMIEAMKSHFDKLYSIELNEAFWRAAKDRFAENPNVEILYGDSGQKLAEIIPRLSGPTLFWLDGHFSGGDTARGDLDTPIMAELSHIISATDLGHVILIDDARHFGSDPAYPTIADITQVAHKWRQCATVEVLHDAIRILPAPGA